MPIHRLLPGTTPFILASGVSSRVARPRFAIPAIVLFAGVTLFSGRETKAADTQYNVINGQTNLNATSTYTTGGTSGTGAGGTAATTGPSVTSDVTFNSGVAYTTPTAFTLGTPATFGSLNDLSTTAITISNTGGTAASTLTLGGPGFLGDGVVGSNAADLFFVGTGATLNITGGTGVAALGIVLGQSGNFDVVGTSTISSIISDGGAGFGITKTGAGTLTLSGANTNSGLTQINAGTLQIGNVATAALGNGGVTIQAGTLLDSSANVAALGTGTLTLGTASTGAGAATFNYNANTGAPVLANAINVASGPTGALTIETTAGALQLSGLITLANNLNVVNTNTAGGNSFNLTGGVAGTGNLIFNATSAGGFNLGPAGTVNFTGTISNVSTGGGGLGISANLTGAESILQNSTTSTTTVSGTNTNTGTTTVARGVLDFGKEVSLYNGTTDTPTATTSNLIVQAGGTAAFQVGGVGTFSATDLATLNALGTATGGFENGSRFGIDTSPGNFTYANAITNNNGGTNSIGLTKLGANTLTLTGANTYSGLTTISAGTLQVGAGGTVGTLGTGSIQNNSTLTFNRTDNYGGPISQSIGGGGAITVVGTGGTLTLSGVNTYSGGTAVSAGTLDVANQFALQNSTLTLSGTGVLVFDAAVTSNAFTIGGLGGNPNIALQNNAATPAPITLTVGNPINNASTSTSGVFSGAGNLVFPGFSNTITLTGANTYTGTTTVTGSTLNLGGGGANGSIGTGSNALVLGGFASGGLFNYTRTGTVTQSFASTTFRAGEDAVSTSTATQTLNLGAISATAGATADINPNTTSSITTTNGNVNGILGGYATYGGKTTWAVAPATPGGAITGLPTASYTASATAGTTPANYANANVDMTASETLTGAINPNSLRFNTSTAYTLTLTGVNTIQSGGILNTAAASNGGTITGGTLTGSAGGQLSITNGSNGASLSINSLIVDNGVPTAVAASGNGGGGYVNFYNASNSFSGGLYFNGGRLGYNSGGTPFGTGTVTFGTQVYTNAGGGGINGGRQHHHFGSGGGRAGGERFQRRHFQQRRHGRVDADGHADDHGELCGHHRQLLGRANGELRPRQRHGDHRQHGNRFELLDGQRGHFPGGQRVRGSVLEREQQRGAQRGRGHVRGVRQLCGHDEPALQQRLERQLGGLDGDGAQQQRGGHAGGLWRGGFARGGRHGELRAADGVQSPINGFTTVNLNTNGILGGYATVGGTDWATNATNVSGGNIIGLSNSTINSYSNDTFGTGLNTNVTTSDNGATTNSIRFNTAAANTVTFNGANSIASGGILVTPNVGGNATTITGGTVTGSAQDLVVIQNNPGAAGALTISSTIGASGTSGLTKSGPGILILAPDPSGGGANVFTGALTINGGIVNTNQDGIGLAGSIVFNGGTLQANGAINGQTEAVTPANIGVVMGINGGTIDTTGGNVTLPGNVTNVAGTQFSGAGAFGGFNSTGVGALTVTGGGTLSLGGTANTFGGGLVINNGTVIDTAASGANTLGTGYLTFGNNANTATVDLNGHNATVAGLIGVGTNGLVTNNSAAASASVLTLNGVSNQTYSGVIQNGTVGTTAITLALNNPLAAQTFTGANTYSGGTLVNVGTLLVNNPTGSGTGSGAVTVGNGTTLNGRLGGTGTIAGATTVNAGSAITGGTFGTVGILTLTSTLNLNGTYAADLGTMSTSDRLVLSAPGTGGILAFGSTASLTFNGTPDGSTYILATYSGDTNFSSLLTNTTTVPAGYSLVDTGTMLELTPVPEPSTWVSAILGALALVGTSLFRRSRRVKA